MATSMRHRGVAQLKNASNCENSNAEEEKFRQAKENLLTSTHWVILGLFLACTMCFIHVRSNSFPEPKTVQGARPGEFVEERARQYLNEITDMGPREVGSDANEIHVVKYLLKKLNHIKDRRNPVHNIDIDVQLTSGSFTLKFLGEFSSVYDNMKNVVVKLGPKSGANHSLLVNCHYDSVLDSPGASDDAVTCCLMIEVLDLLSRRSSPLLHNIIFIFNGAEENILQASHGFITQHEWAKDIRAFVNLDSAGAGGRELLFQAGPEHPWLIQTYAQNVPHPFASTFGQEVFESGFIPSDTDFRIYRDYGNVPGLDIAYIHNGYVYHTKWDSPEMIPPGCMQRGGENLLVLVSSIADSPLLAHPGEYKHGSFVFFDVVGLFVIMYPARIGLIVNTFTIVIVLVGIMRKIMGAHPQTGVFGQWYLRQLVKSVGVIIVSWVGTIAGTLAIGLAVHLLGRPMAFYTRPWMMIGLYACPAIAINMYIHCAIKKKLYKKIYSNWDIEMVFFDATMVLMLVPLSLMTYKSINSAVLFLISVLLPLLVRDRICYLFNIKYRDNHTTFIVLHLLGTGFPMLIKLYFLYGVLDMFVPVMGRIGPGIIPDVFMAGLVSFFVLLTLSYQTSLIYVTRRIKPILTVLSLAFGVTLLAVFLTPMGFPYAADPSSPSRQRHVLHHIDRNFHDINGKVTEQDAGIMMIPFDRYALDPLKGVIPQVDKAKLGECKGPYCGWPYYFAMLCIMKDVYYIPDKPLSVVRPTFHIVNRTKIADNKERITIESSGPNHVIVYISPRAGITLTRWSVGNGIPLPTQMPPHANFDTYFIYYSYGTRPEKPWSFWIDVQVPEGFDNSSGVVDIAVSGHYWFGEDRWTPSLRSFVDQFPDWTFPVSWTATYDAYVL